jgi:hypothetical protein
MIIKMEARVRCCGSDVSKEAVGEDSTAICLNAHRMEHQGVAQVPMGPHSPTTCILEDWRF